MTERTLTLATRVVWLISQPLSTLWIIAAALLVTTIVASIVGDAFYWTGVLGLGTVVGVTHLAARVRAVPAWPCGPAGSSRTTPRRASVRKGSRRTDRQPLRRG
jgi:hypothetical protein